MYLIQQAGVSQPGHLSLALVVVSRIQRTWRCFEGPDILIFCYFTPSLDPFCLLLRNGLRTGASIYAQQSRVSARCCVSETRCLVWPLGTPASWNNERESPQAQVL